MKQQKLISISKEAIEAGEDIIRQLNKLGSKTNFSELVQGLLLYEAEKYVGFLTSLENEKNISRNSDPLLYEHENILANLDRIKQIEIKMKYIKKLEQIKKDLFKTSLIYSNNVKKIKFQLELNRLILLSDEFSEVYSKEMIDIKEEFSKLKEALEREDYAYLSTLCNYTEQEDKWLIHILKKRDRQDIINKLFGENNGN